MVDYNPIILAMDTDNCVRADNMASWTHNYVGGFKIGLEYFVSNGYKKWYDKPTFLDLKLHDIPNTVAKTVDSLVCAYHPKMLSIHACGSDGMERIKAAKSKAQDTLILAVTVLTSEEQTDDTPNRVFWLAWNARENGADGVICSGNEVSLLRTSLGSKLIIVTPGIRMDYNDAYDQCRVTTPFKSMKNGSSYLVIGRPITEADNPGFAAKQILGSINE